MSLGPSPPEAGTADRGVGPGLTAVVSAERAKLVAALIRVTGDWDLAEDCVQDAIEKALGAWPTHGVPDNPAAWLTTVARNRAIDVLRRRSTEAAKLQEVAVMDVDAPAPQLGGSTAVDDRLSLIFTCCHPALDVETRVALTLKTVAGLSTGAIASAFLVSEPTLSQRLLRAKRKIAHAAIPYRVPAEDRLAERTSGVLAVIYLIFNQGYGQRQDHVAAEAVELARLLVLLMPDEDEARGLLALVLLQQARRSTRFDGDGGLVPMEEQDRGRWDARLLDEGRWQLRRAASAGRPAGPYRLQAAIAARHALAPDVDSTDWGSIVELYDGLVLALPSPVVAFNRAIAIGFRDGFEDGLRELDRIADPALSAYHLVPAARADFQRRLGRVEAARASYRQALDLAPTDAARKALLRRLDDL